MFGGAEEGRMRRYALLGSLLALVALLARPAPGQPEKKLDPAKIEELKRKWAKNKKVIPPATQEALEKAERMELYSLDPAAGGENKDGFHGWKALGKTELKTEEARRAVAKAIVQGNRDSLGRTAKCFEPRHGVRAT